MRVAPFSLGLIASLLVSAQDTSSQPVNGGLAQLATDCQFEIPPCENPLDPPGGNPTPAPPPAPGGGGIHNLPGAPVFKETIIVPGNNMLKEFKLDQPKMLEMQRQLQNR